MFGGGKGSGGGSSGTRSMGSAQCVYCQKSGTIQQILQYVRT